MSFSIGEWHEGIPIVDNQEGLVATTWVDEVGIRRVETAAKVVRFTALWGAREECTE